MDQREILLKYVDSLLALADCYPEYDVFQIDMVIGLCSSVDQIRSDASFEKRGTVYLYGYSGSRKPPVRRNGNQLSGVWKPF